MKHLRSKIFVLKLGLISLPLAALLHTPNASAQSEAEAPSKPMPPPGPLLAPAPGFSQWTITFSYGEAQKETGLATASAAPQPITGNMAVRARTIITTKTGEIIHEETLTLGGDKTEDWQVHGDYYVKYPGKSFWSAYEKADPTEIASRNRVAMGLPPSGFRDLDWIGKETYAGETKTDSGYCLIFVPGGLNTLNAEDPSQQNKLGSLPKIAYIDAETRLPVMVRAAGETRVFKFTQPPPTSIQSLPGDLADEIKQGDEIRAQRNAAPQREY